MRRRLLLVRTLCTLGLLIATHPAHALTIVSHVERYNVASDAFQFSLTLSGPPDLITLDGAGRPQDEFQYYVTWDLHPGQPFFPIVTPDVLVRGGEIAYVGQIPIRDRLGDPSPHSGGWGTVRGTVPYQLNGSTITFEVPRAMVGDPDGKFQYYLAVERFGGTTDTKTGVSLDDPTPTERTSWGRIKRMYR